jgi:hypothetical protein
MSAGKGKTADRVKSANHKYDSNVMGLFEEGQLVNHGGKHTGRLVRLAGKLSCGKCKQAME